MTDPKSRFLESKDHVQRHRDYVDSATFVAASDATLCKMVADLPTAATAEEAAAQFHRIAGARDFLKLFSDMGEQRKRKPAMTRSDNLNHNV